MDLNFLFLIFIAIIFLVAIYIIPLAIATGVKRNRERQRESAVAQTVLRHGLRPIPHPEIPSLARNVIALVWPSRDVKAHAEVLNERIEKAFSLRGAGREAFFYEWSYGYIQMEGGGHVYQRAYLVLGPDAPHLLVVPRGAFGEPAEPIDFPEDVSFSKTFWIEGRDKEAVRRYLGSDLRSFLLTHGKGSVFQAGPEGVVLVKIGRMPATEASEMSAILERLAIGTEAAARRLRW